MEEHIVRNASEQRQSIHIQRHKHTELNVGLIHILGLIGIQSDDSLAKTQ